MPSRNVSFLVRISTPLVPGFVTVMVPLESVESFTLIVLNGIERLLLMVRFSTTGEACAEVLEAMEGVADPVTGTVADRVAVAVDALVEPQALSTSRLL